MDHLSPEQRSRLMSNVRGQDTGVEIRLRRLMWANGFRYRKNHSVRGVKVDLAFPWYRLVVFIDGCFWHGCPAHYSVPKTRREFWAEKIRTNVERDRRQTVDLEEQGWTVVRVWEHKVNLAPESVAQEIIDIIRSGRKPRKMRDWRVVGVKQLGGGSDVDWLLEDLRSEDIKKVMRKGARARKNGKVA